MSSAVSTDHLYKGKPQHIWPGAAGRSTLFGREGAGNPVERMGAPTCQFTPS